MTDRSADLFACQISLEGTCTGICSVEGSSVAGSYRPFWRRLQHRPERPTACDPGQKDDAVVTLSSQPLQGEFVFRVPSGDRGGATGFAVEGDSHGLSIDPGDGVITVADGRRLPATEPYRRLAIRRASSCFMLGLNIRARDIAAWLKRGAFAVADFRRGEYAVDGRLYVREEDFRSALGGTFERATAATALDAGRGLIEFAPRAPAITDRGLLLQDARRQYLSEPDRPRRQRLELTAGTYTLQMWGRGSVGISGAPASAATELEPAKFTVFEPTHLTVEPSTPDGATPAVRRFQLTNGPTPTAWMASEERDADLYDLDLDLRDRKSLAVVVDIDMPPRGAAYHLSLTDTTDRSRLIVRIAEDGGASVVSMDGADRRWTVPAGRVAERRGSRLALSLMPGVKDASFLSINGKVAARMSVDAGAFRSLAHLRLGRQTGLDGNPGHGLNAYVKKLVLLPDVPMARAGAMLGSPEDWALPATHKPLAALVPVDPLILDLEKLAPDAVFPAIDPRTEEFSSRLTWTQSYPTPSRNVIIVGARTKLRSVRNVLGARGNENLAHGPAQDSQRVDTDTIRTTGTVWEIGGTKTTRSVVHSANSVLRAGIYRRMNPRLGYPADWAWATRNDPHQSRLAWNVRDLVRDPYDYYVDLLTVDVQGTVEGYHGDAGMQWQPWTTDGAKSPIGGIPLYCGHYNVEWTTYYAGFFLPVQYVSKDRQLNETAPLPRWLRIHRVHGRMLAEYRIYEHPELKPANILVSPGNVTSAFYHLDLSRDNNFGSFRPYPVDLKDFYITPFPGRPLIDHIRPLNGKPIRQYIDVARQRLVDVDGMADRSGNVRFPPETRIDGEIKAGAPRTPFADAAQEYGPGPWYWPRFEGMVY